VQNSAARLVTGLRRKGHITPILKSLHWFQIRQRVTYKLATLVHKCVNGRAPEYLAEFCHPNVDRRPGMRSAVSAKAPSAAHTDRAGGRTPRLDDSAPPDSLAGGEGALLPPSPRTPLTILSSCLSCVYVHTCMTMHCYFLLNVKHGASQLYLGGLQLSSAGTAHRLHLVTGRSPSLDRAPGTTYLWQSEICL